MSTSKGLGASAAQIAEVIPPEQLRLLFLRPRPNTAIEFDPDGTDAIPRLFDESDRLAAATAGREVRGELPPHHDRVFALQPRRSRCGRRRRGGRLPPGLQPPRAARADPGRRRRGAGDRREGVAAAPIASSRSSTSAAPPPGPGSTAYAPERARLVGPSRRACPSAPRTLDDEQRAYLGALAEALEGADVGRRGACRRPSSRPPRSASCRPGRAFAALYLAFLGRPSGPRAGWLLAALDRDVRHRAAARGGRRRGGARERRPPAPPRRRRSPPKRATADKGEDPAVVDRAVELDERRRALVGRGRRAQGRAQRGEPAASGRRSVAGPIRTGRRSAELKAASAATAERIDGARRRARHRSRPSSTTRCSASRTPPIPTCPVGGEEANVVVRTWGEPLPRGERKPHWELAESLGLIDNARGAKVTGSGLAGLSRRRLDAPARPHRLVPRRPLAASTA